MARCGPVGLELLVTPAADHARGEGGPSARCDFDYRGQGTPVVKAHHPGDRDPGGDQPAGGRNSAPWGAPSLIVRTGGGLHNHLAFVEPLDAHDPATRELLTRAGWWITCELNGRGYAADAGVTKDINRVLRAAGTTNRKAGRADAVTVLHADPTRRFLVEDIEPYLPDEDPTAAAGRAAAPAAVTPVVASAHRASKPASDRPGDKLNANHGALPALMDAAGLHRADSAGMRWYFLREDGSLPADTSASIVTSHDGIDRLMASSRRLAEQWGFAPTETGAFTPWSAFELLTNRWCAGNYALADRRPPGPGRR